MRAYRIRDVYSDDHSTTDAFAKSRRLAQDKMMQIVAEFRPGIQIDLLELPRDIDNVVAILSRKDFEYTVIRSWRGTRRGGLREVDTAPSGTRIEPESVQTPRAGAPRDKSQARGDSIPTS